MITTEAWLKPIVRLTHLRSGCIEIGASAVIQVSCNVCTMGGIIFKKKKPTVTVFVRDLFEKILRCTQAILIWRRVSHVKKLL